MSQSSTVAINAFTSFGRLLKDCKVQSFRAEKTEEDFKSQFIGDRGSNVPFGPYRALLDCSGQEVSGEVLVDEPVKSVVLTVNQAALVFDHTKPALSIKLLLRKRSSKFLDKVWWVRLTSEYGDTIDTVMAEPETAVARFFSVQPGRYIAAFYSDAGYYCFKEVDIGDLSRSWTFNENTCHLTTDRFAYIVKRNKAFQAEDVQWIESQQQHFQRLEKSLDKIR